MKGINHHIIDYRTIQKNKKFDAKLVKQVLPLYFEGNEVKIARLYGGFRNTTVYVSKGDEAYVLRIYTNKKREKEYDENFGKTIRAEWSFVAYLRNNGVPVPELVPNKKGELISKYNDTYVVLMNYIDGVDGRYNLNDKKFMNLGTLMANMHKSSQGYPSEQTRVFPTKNPFEYLKEKIGSEDPDLYCSLSEVYRLYEETVSKIEALPKHLIHGDLIFSNILFRKNNIAGILDFDDIRRGMFIEELATLIISTYDHHKLYNVSLSYIDNFMQSYTHTRALSQQEKELLPLYLNLSRLGIRRMLKKYRPELLERYLMETQEVIHLVKSKYL